MRTQRTWLVINAEVNKEQILQSYSNTVLKNTLLSPQLYTFFSCFHHSRSLRSLSLQRQWLGGWMGGYKLSQTRPQPRTMCLWGAFWNVMMSHTGCENMLGGRSFGPNENISNEHRAMRKCAKGAGSMNLSVWPVITPAAVWYERLVVPVMPSANYLLDTGLILKNNCH